MGSAAVVRPGKIRRSRQTGTRINFTTGCSRFIAASRGAYRVSTVRRGRRSRIDLSQDPVTPARIANRSPGEPPGRAPGDLGVGREQHPTFDSRTARRDETGGEGLWRAVDFVQLLR